MKKYIKVSQTMECRPQFVVCEVDENGYGDDIAWFFKEEDRQEYLDFKNATSMPLEKYIENSK